MKGYNYFKQGQEVMILLRSWKGSHKGTITRSCFARPMTLVTVTLPEGDYDFHARNIAKNIECGTAPARNLAKE